MYIYHIILNKYLNILHIYIYFRLGSSKFEIGLDNIYIYSIHYIQKILIHGPINTNKIQIYCGIY
jgi:hypothetical protein